MRLRHWLRRLICIHQWHHTRDGSVRTWTCTRCGHARIYRGQVPPKAPPSPRKDPS